MVRPIRLYDYKKHLAFFFILFSRVETKKISGPVLQIAHKSNFCLCNKFVSHNAIARRLFKYTHRLVRISCGDKSSLCMLSLSHSLARHKGPHLSYFELHSKVRSYHHKALCDYVLRRLEITQ